MKVPPIAANESERLRALTSYGSLDDLHDPSLDALVRAAARTCDAPIALVSLVDDRRQRFVANFGLVGVDETARNVSFCAHAIVSDAVMVVSDAMADERFVDNPLVTDDPTIRFYAGAPLIDSSGLALGTLCVIDRVSRSLSEEQVAMLHDLSEAVTTLLRMKRTERALRAVVDAEAAARQQLAIVLEKTPGMLAYWNPDLTNRFANRAYLGFFGHERESVKGMSLREVVGEQLFHQEKPLIEAALKGTVQRFERTRFDADGNRQTAVGEYTPDIRDGAVVGVVLTLADVSEARAALHELQRRNELLSLSEDVANLGHWRFDVLTGAVFWSPQIFHIHRLDPRSFVPTLENAVAACHPEDRDRVSAAVGLAVETGAPFDFELRIRRPNGELRRVHSRGLCERDPATGATSAVFGVFQDITDRENLRERVVRQERLVTVGTLAAGVGHEINNPLTFISANVEHALEEVASISGGSPSARMRDLFGALHEARDGAERIRKIVRGLRAFAREEATAVPTDVNAAVDVSANMAMHEIRHRATLELQLGIAPMVLADEAQLAQVLVNLLVNAAQAFETNDPGRNRIVVTTAERPDGAVSIEVCDNGPGIPKEIQSRVFDPFFTTKRAGEGTGLGLSISQSIVFALQGELACESVPGVGTTFRISLPAAAIVEPLPALRATVESGRRGRIMVIDDERPILRIFDRLLRSEHEIVGHSDPREAVRVLAVSGDSFDLVFCDLMMAQLTGIEVFREIESRAPQLASRFVFMTGGTTTAEAQGFLEEVSNERIEKPFASDNIRAIARRFVTAGTQRR